MKRLQRGKNVNDERFAQCMKSIAEGDKTALKEIYEEYLPYLYSVVYGVVQQKEAAEDVTSEVFLRIWKTAEKYRPGNGHKGYLATIARNMAIDELRKHKREVLPDDEEDDIFSSTASDEQGPEEQGDPCDRHNPQQHFHQMGACDGQCHEAEPDPLPSVVHDGQREQRSLA